MHFVFCFVIINALGNCLTTGFRVIAYESSPWEEEWLAMDEQQHYHVCSLLASEHHLTRSKWAVHRSQTLKRSTAINALPPLQFEMRDIFSRFIVEDDSGQLSTKWIEPLVGQLRDPLTWCENLRADAGEFEPTEGWIQAKRFLLPLLEPIPPPRRFILMDLGASLYVSWGRDPTAVGAKWFVDVYGRFGIVPDLVISMEKVHYPQEQLFDSPPAHLLGKYVYMNVGVASDPGARFNPWSILANVARPDDFVLVKLDVDNKEIELELARQLLHNATVQSLVDEFFFEFHPDEEQKAHNAFAFFKKLRVAGVRAHFWP